MAKRVLVVGAGFSGATVARVLTDRGFNPLVVEAANHVGGHAHTKRNEYGIMEHVYGPHIFNTDYMDVWAFVQRFGEFRPFYNRVKAVNRKGVFSFPVNLHTINQFFQRIMSPEKARAFIAEQCSHYAEPANFEEQALSMVGRDLYEVFFKHYTRKQWGRDPKELSAAIIKRVPLRFDYNDLYYSTAVQAIPVEGYTRVVENMLAGIEVQLETQFNPDMIKDFQHVFYSGPIDAFFNYSLGRLSYRTLEFKRITREGDIQGNAVINVTDDLTPYTRISEHKHFTPWESHSHSVAYAEIARDAAEADAPFYPIRTKDDLNLLRQYQLLAEELSNVTFLGRLGQYRYLDMDDVIHEAIRAAQDKTLNLL